MEIFFLKHWSEYAVIFCMEHPVDSMFVKMKSLGSWMATLQPGIFLKGYSKNLGQSYAHNFLLICKDLYAPATIAEWGALSFCPVRRSIHPTPLLVRLCFKNLALFLWKYKDYNR